MGADGPHCLQEARGLCPLGFRLGRLRQIPDLRGRGPASLLLEAPQLSPHKGVRTHTRLLAPLTPRPRSCARVPCWSLCDFVPSDASALCGSGQDEGRRCVPGSCVVGTPPPQVSVLCSGGQRSPIPVFESAVAQSGASVCLSDLLPRPQAEVRLVALLPWPHDLLPPVTARPGHCSEGSVHPRGQSWAPAGRVHPW